MTNPKPVPTGSEGERDIVERLNRLLDYKTLTGDEFAVRYGTVGERQARGEHIKGFDVAWRSELATLEDALSEIRRLRAEAEEHDASFDLYDRCMKRAQGLYYEQHPDFPKDVWPDGAKSIAALFEELGRLRAALGEREPVAWVQRIQLDGGEWTNLRVILARPVDANDPRAGWFPLVPLPAPPEASERTEP